MTAVNGKLFLVVSMMMMMFAVSWAQNFGDGEVPSVLSYNSPLRQPDSLRSRPYFDFLSTLYRHDSDKTNLFQPYLQRNRRDVPEVPAVAAAAPVAQTGRSRRAIVFRPLFVYRQQQIRRQEVREQNRRRY